MAFWKKKEPPQITPGKLIAIEGIDGVGKSTQLELLARTLTDHNYEGMIFEFPQYSEVSIGLLKKYLSGDYGQLSPEAASILFAIDRMDASKAINEQLNQGKIILTKRYAAANAAHQGHVIADKSQRIKFYRWLDWLEYSTFNIPRPDLTIVLHAPAEILYADNPPANSEQVNNQNIIKSYIEIANLLPNVKLVDCSTNGQMLTPAEIHTKVWELIRRIVLKNNAF